MARVALQQMRSPLEGLARVIAIKEAQARSRQLAEAEKEKTALRQAIASGDWNAVMQIDPQLGAWGQDRAREEKRRGAMAGLVEGQLPPNQTVPLPPVPGAAGEPPLTKKEIQPSPLRDLSTQDPDFVWKLLEAQKAAKAKPPAAYPSSRYLVGEEGQPVPSTVYEPEFEDTNYTVTRPDGSEIPLTIKSQEQLDQAIRQYGEKNLRLGGTTQNRPPRPENAMITLYRDGAEIKARESEAAALESLGWSREKKAAPATMGEINSRVKMILSRYASTNALGGWEEDPYKIIVGLAKQKDRQAQIDLREIQRLNKQAKEIVGTGGGVSPKVQEKIDLYGGQ